GYGGMDALPRRSDSQARSLKFRVGLPLPAGLQSKHWEAEDFMSNLPDDSLFPVAVPQLGILDEARADGLLGDPANHLPEGQTNGVFPKGGIFSDGPSDAHPLLTTPQLETNSSLFQPQDWAILFAGNPQSNARPHSTDEGPTALGVVSSAAAGSGFPTVPKA